MKKVTFKQSIKAGALASLVAITVNAILFFIFHSNGVLDDTIQIQPNQSLTLVPIIISSLFPTMIASIVFFLLEKYTNNGFKYFAGISIVLGLLSLISPFMGIPNVTDSYAIVLDIMHVVVVSSLLFFIYKEAKATN